MSLGTSSVFAVKGSPNTTRVVGLAGLLVLLGACFGATLFGGRQFAFRDAAHFYYPLYHRVQDEWAWRELPLWEPMANGGTPLLGSPMAAVLYPGKLIFAMVPFAWGMRLYVVAHVVLAFAAMVALARSFGLSSTAAFLAGFSYAFGGPVLSTYFNVIYLVGAAWAPLGFRAADRWLRLGHRWGLAELAVVLTMQVLGGDAEAAYITVLCAFGYAFGLVRRSVTTAARVWLWVPGLAALAIGWAWAGPTAAGRCSWRRRPHRASDSRRDLGSRHSPLPGDTRARVSRPRERRAVGPGRVVPARDRPGGRADTAGARAFDLKCPLGRG